MGTTPPSMALGVLPRVLGGIALARYASGVHLCLRTVPSGRHTNTPSWVRISCNLKDSLSRRASLLMNCERHGHVFFLRSSNRCTSVYGDVHDRTSPICWCDSLGPCKQAVDRTS